MENGFAAVVAIQQVLNRYPEAVDARSWSTFDEVFTSDVECDMSAMGLGTTHSREELVALFDRIEHPVAHHLVNPVVEVAGDGADVRSKWLVVLADCSTLSGIYDDRFVRTPQGWRIQRRVVTARQAGSRRPVPAYDLADDPAIRERDGETGES